MLSHHILETVCSIMNQRGGMSCFPISNHIFKECAYIINLKKRTDKRKLMEYKLNTMNLTNYRFFDAVNGADSMYDDIYEIVESKGKYTSKGAFGLLVTYINLLEDAYKHDYERILILEDDVNFHNKYFDLVVKYSNIINDSRYDIIWLGANQRVFSKKQLDSISSQFIYLPEPKNNNYTYGTFSILLNRSGIVKMLKIVNNHNIIALKPIDIIINDMMRSDILQGVVCYPYLFMPDVSDSDNMGPRNQNRFSISRRFVSNNYNYVSQQDITILHKFCKNINGSVCINFNKIMTDKNTLNAYNHVINFLSNPCDLIYILTF